MQIDLGRGDVFVTHDILDLAQIRAAFQQVGGERVPQGATRHPFVNSGRFRRPLDRAVVDFSKQMMAPPDTTLRIGGNLPRRENPKPLETFRGTTIFSR